MRRFGLACCLLVCLAASCSSSNTPEAPEGPVGAADSAIAYGSADTTHTAVVALLAPTTTGFSECSGTVVQIKNGQGYVLTAAHCCNKTAPTVVVIGNDYSPGVAALSGPVNPPAYAVAPSSVWYDTQYDQMHYDFCMLKFAAPSGTAVIPVATPSDGLMQGEQVEHVGFGATDTNTNNSGRRTGTAPIDQGLDQWTMTSSQGGPTHIKGVCEGDSGGPALVPAGAPQAQQKVVGTTSYGNNTTCSMDTLNVCMRVTSESAAGGFIANYLADTPSGTQVGSAAQACQTCAQGSEQGACMSQAQACANDAACTTLSTCLGNCTTQACNMMCTSAAGTAAVNELNAFDNCVCSTACASQCASACGTATSCGLTTGDTTCDACINGSCCAQAKACASDAACLTCLGQTPPCTTSATATAVLNCINTNCASQCGGSSSSSSATTTSASSSTSGGHPSSSATGTTSTGTGMGATSTGAGGTAGAGGGGGAPNSGNGGSTGAGGQGNLIKRGSCSVGADAGDASSSSASMACLLLGAALAFSKRRRALH
jgi:hypothetical protein